RLADRDRCQVPRGRRGAADADTHRDDPDEHRLERRGRRPEPARAVRFDDDLRNAARDQRLHVFAGERCPLPRAPLGDPGARPRPARVEQAHRGRLALDRPVRDRRRPSHRGGVVMRRRFPKPRLAIATLVGLLAVLAGGYTFVIKPQRQKLQTVGAQIEEAQAQLAAAQAPPAANPDAAPIRVADLFRLSRAMPDKADLPDVLLQLSQIATETGITFTSITPGDPVVVDNYQRIPIDLVFEGHFYDLSDFLYRLRNLVGVHDSQLDA